MTDSEYRRLLQASPLKAQRALFDEYFCYVYAIVHGKLKGCAARENIDECVSDVFSDVFLCYDKNSGFDGDLKGYIGTVASRKAVNLFHKLAREKTRFVPAEASELQRIPDRMDVQEAAEASELKRILLTKIGELGEPDSVIILRKYYAGMTSAQIAAEVSLSPEAVRMRCGRALKKLKKLLSEEGYTLKEG